MKLKLTKKSENQLNNYHAGVGHMWLSMAGNGGYKHKHCDIMFICKNGKYILSMGIGRATIELTPEQAQILGCFAVEEDFNE